MMSADAGEERLLAQLQNTQALWAEAYDRWAEGNSTVLEILGNLERLLSPEMAFPLLSGSARDCDSRRSYVPPSMPSSPPG